MTTGLPRALRLSRCTCVAAVVGANSLRVMLHLEFACGRLLGIGAAVCLLAHSTSSLAWVHAWDM